MSVNRPTIEFAKVPELTHDQRMELFEFCDRFSSRRRVRFEAALDKEQVVFFVRGDRTEHLIGFGTASVFTVEHDGQAASVLYTGWAMLDPVGRGRGVFQRVALRMLLEERRAHPFRPMFWLLMSSTINSYLVAVHTYPITYPSHRYPWREREKAFAEQALAGIGATGDPDTGVVGRSGASFYREGRLDESHRDSDDPDIAFYAAANPGQADGDTLVVLAPLSASNLASAVWRYSKKMIRRRRKKRLSTEG